ncbi:hypothetical protein H7J06_06555 [Mycobacterium hodleri]|uniref:hypothetical protein n=1 Tax=Mycolicibacterium hodleri TaxID=49897 RepID=UPI0021F394E9|nr:hypothetical protein [Mycolicibacterium hodleri]MCV7132645.1 hypothetical protein [Mycolicibacterium hodleri]
MSTHLRVAAGACVLSTGFMIAGAGGAVASADVDSDGSASGAAAGPTHNPVGTFADNVRKAVENSLQGTVQGVTGALSTLTRPGQIPSMIPKSPKTTFGGSPTVYGSTAPTTATPATPTPPEESATTAPEQAASDQAAPEQTAPEQTAPDQQVDPAPVSAPAAPPQANKNPGAPVANAVTSLANSIAAVPGVVAGLPTSTTPISDVLASLENVLTSAGDAGTSLTTLPSDLAGLLGVDTTVATPSIGASTGLPRQMRTVTPDPATPVWSAAPDLSSLLGAAGDPATVAPALPVVPMDVATKGPVSGPVEATPPASAPEPSGKNDVLSTVEHAIGAFVATVSLTALAAWALPGILGLLTTCAAGIRVGYRQARAASALPNTAISRFVGSGPVGVVRSSSQVEMRSRTPRVVQPAVKVDRRPALRVVGSESSTTQVLDKAV